MKRITLLASTLVLNGLLAFSAHAKHIDYDDVFALEYAASPSFFNQERAVLYAHRSMDIMHDRVKQTLWKASLDSDEPTPLLGEIAGLSSWVLSPDDTRLAYVVSKEGKQHLFIHYFSADRAVKIAQFETPVRALTWSPDGESLVFLNQVVQAETVLFKDMPKKPKGAKWAPKAKVVDQIRYRADGGGYRKPGYTGVFRISAKGGLVEALSEEGKTFRGPLHFTPDGDALLAASNLHPKPELVPLGGDIMAYQFATQSWHQVTDLTGNESSPQVSADGKWLAYLHTPDEKLSYQFAQLHVRPIGKFDDEDDKPQAKSLTLDLDRSVQRFAWSDDNRHLVFSYLDGGRTRIAKARRQGGIIGMTAEAGGQSLGRPYTSGQFALSTRDDLVYTYSDAKHPAELWWQDSDGKAQVLTDLNEDWLKQRTLAEVSALQVKSTVDGRAIDAWVATPPDFDPAKSYPLILEIHGGPHAAYGPQFSMEIQLMAAKGYIVVWSNPRGSSSYGKEFGNLIHHNYPSDDYQDLMDVVDAVIARGNVDTDHLYVTGGSGGGVLTAWSVGKTDRFRAAVVAKPVINWMSFALTADSYPYFTQYWMGDMPWNINEKLWAHSPLSLVGNVTTPTMLLTGEADYRTPISETEQYYQALVLREVDTAMVRLPGASHGIASRPSRLAQKIGNILAWFEKYKEKDASDSK